MKNKASHPFQITKEHVGKKLTATCLTGDSKDPVVVEVFPFKDDPEFAHVRVTYCSYVEETKSPIKLPFAHLCFPKSALGQSWEVQPHVGIRSFKHET